MPAERFANDFATTLSAAVTDTVGTSISVAASAPAALQGGQFRVRVDDEFMLVTATGASGASPWTVTRGVEGSVAATHASAAPVTHVLTVDALAAVGIAPSMIDAKGDLLVGTADDTIARKAAGTNGYGLVPDSAAGDGLAWRQPDRVYKTGRYYGPIVGTTPSSLAIVALRIDYTPMWFARTVSLDRIGVNVLTSAAATTIRLGIYADDGTGLPAGLLIDAGTVDSSTTGGKEIVISQAVVGLVWLAAVNIGGTPACSGNNIVPNISVGVLQLANACSGVCGAYYEASVGGALPATAAPTDGISACHRVVVRVA